MSESLLPLLFLIFVLWLFFPIQIHYSRRNDARDAAVVITGVALTILALKKLAEAQQQKSEQKIQVKK